MAEDHSKDLSRSIALARDAAKLAGVETDPEAVREAEGDRNRTNASYAFELEGVEDGPQLGTIEAALESVPGVTAQLVYSTSMAWITAPVDLDPQSLEELIASFGVKATMTDSTLRRRQLLANSPERHTLRQTNHGVSERVRKRRRLAAADLSAAREAGFLRRTEPKADQESDFDVLFTARDLVTPTRLIAAIVLSLPVIVLSYLPALQFDGWQWVAFALATPVVLWCAFPFHRAMAGGVRRGISALDGASSVAIIAAYLWSLIALLFTPAGDIGWTSSGGWLPTRRGDELEIFLDVSCGITAMLLIGRYFTKRVGENLVDAMRRLTPGPEEEYEVTRRGRGEDALLPASEINRGDDLVLTPGKVVPVDGEVIGGSATVHYLLVDGSSHPTLKVGDSIAAGTVIESGRVKVRAKRIGHATRWASVSRWVADASKRENEATAVSTHSAGMLIPAAYVLALLDFGMWVLLTGDYNAAFSTALAILAVVAPVALAISPALATRNGIEAAARNGILVRDGAVLRRAEEIDTVVFNRVGTLVEPEMTVETITAAQGEDVDLVLLIAAALLVDSNHPSARAIVAAAREAKDHGTPWRVEPEGAEVNQDGSCAGRVVARRVDTGDALDTLDVAGKVVVAGAVENEAADSGETEATRLDARLWRPTNLSQLSGRLALAATSGGTPIVVRYKGRDRGVITLHDPFKADAADAVYQLEKMGITTVMLSRDTYAVARRFADVLGITSVLAGITAQNKPAAVRQVHTRGANVAMVGSASVMDVVKVADVGIIYSDDEFFEAGHARPGAEVDAVIMRDDVSAVPQLLEHGRRVSRIIDSNMVLAGVYNGVAVVLAALAILPPMGATLLMLGSSLVIEYRSRRAGRFPQSGGFRP
ncbi:heavy metal translocating P-type ATPase [Corynebacterium glaucum]|uniref:heavy metal translocating P-type ATPase n=1 Tax=Corynebacterium glaucum TaxID=187491 RepID=UPI00265A9552|nr:HAD family hydrolase [Corynebacterium glaucum]